MIEIDGSFGEGGGQILRTSLSLSLITGKAFRIANIRARRKLPGLLRQHLTAVLAAAEISGAKTEGAQLGSTALVFSPGVVRPGEYKFSVGTAGSGTLVLQTILPALMISSRMTDSRPSRIVIEGGTHNSAAPPFDFLARTFVPLVERMGPKIALKLERYGFYPAGGGRFTAEIQPVEALAPLHLGERGETRSRRVIGVVASLPRHIAQREVETAAKMLNWPADTAVLEEIRDSAGPGNVVMIEVGSGEVTEIFSAFGEVQLSAEKVASIAARDVRDYLVSRAVAGEHLTDQLLLPMALAGEGSFTAEKINLHARTNMAVISRFLPVRFDIEPGEGFTRLAIAD